MVGRAARGSHVLRRVAAWAGHSDLGLTKRTYVHRDPQSLKAGSDKPTELLG